MPSNAAYTVNEMDITTTTEHSDTDAMTEDTPRSDSDVEAVDKADGEETDLAFKDVGTPAAPNIYVGKRNFIHQLMDVALLMANVSQLKALLSLDEEDKYYKPLLGFIIMSISMQVMFTVIMLFIWAIEKKLEEHSTELPPKVYPGDSKLKQSADWLDRLGNILVLLIIVSNVFITGFGVEAHSSSRDPTQTLPPNEITKTLANGTTVK